MNYRCNEHNRTLGSCWLPPDAAEQLPPDLDHLAEWVALPEA
ncbi:MAG: hypothetical protein VCC20_08940 [Myxococcota bacterium]